MQQGIQTDCEIASTFTGQQTCPEMPDFQLDFHLGFSLDQFYNAISLPKPNRSTLALQITNYLQKKIACPPTVQHSLFQAKKVPKISLLHYLQRIQKYAQLQDSTFLIAVIYIERFQSVNFVLDLLNVHKVLFVAIVIASKYNEDSRLQNKDFAKIGGVSVKELFMLEIEFMKCLKFNLKISSEEFARISELQFNQDELPEISLMFFFIFLFEIFEFFSLFFFLFSLQAFCFGLYSTGTCNMSQTEQNVLKF